MSESDDPNPAEGIPARPSTDVQDEILRLLKEALGLAESGQQKIVAASISQAIDLLR